MTSRLQAIPWLAVFLSILSPATSVRADGPPVEPMPNVVLPPPANSPTMPGAIVAPTVPVALVPEKAPEKPGHPLLAHLLHPHSWGCGSDPYNPGCDSCEDECIFLFGSCREFYREPCYKKSPQPWALYGPWGLYATHP